MGPRDSGLMTRMLMVAHIEFFSRRKRGPPSGNAAPLGQPPTAVVYSLVFQRPGAESFCFCSRTDYRLFSCSWGKPSPPPRPLPLVSGGTNGAASNGASGASPLFDFASAAGRQQHGTGAAAPFPGGAGMNLNAFPTAFQGNVGTGPAAPVLMGGFALGTDGGLCVCVHLCVSRNIKSSSRQSDRCRGMPVYIYLCACIHVGIIK